MNRCGYTRNRAACLVASLLLWPGLHNIAYAGDGSHPLTLNLGDYRFVPDRMDVTAGQPVILVLVNKDGMTPHNFTLQDEQAGLDLDVDVSAGQTAGVNFTPATAGSYSFYCNKKLPFMKSHRDRGMWGRLVVNEAR